MKKVISKTKATEIIDSFFQKDNFSPEELKKIKRLAMKYQIKLGAYKRKFCKKCLSPLTGKIRINNNIKTIECESCGYKNRHKIF